MSVFKFWARVDDPKPPRRCVHCNLTKGAPDTPYYCTKSPTRRRGAPHWFVTRRGFV